MNQTIDVNKFKFDNFNIQINRDFCGKIFATGNIPDCYMAKPVLSKSERSDWFFLGRDFAVQPSLRPCNFVLEQSRKIF